MIEVLKQMVEALEWCHGGEPVGTADAIKAGKKLIAELESQYPHGMYGAEDLDKAWKSGYDNCKDQFAYLDEQEPVAHPVIAGVLFDFMGWLTSRKERIVLSSADNASPAADAIRDFANMRGLSLDDAKVLDWSTTPPQRTWVGLTDEEISELIRATHNTGSFVRAIDAKLKEKNT